MPIEPKALEGRNSFSGSRNNTPANVIHSLVVIFRVLQLPVQNCLQLIQLRNRLLQWLFYRLLYILPLCKSSKRCACIHESYSMSELASASHSLHLGASRCEPVGVSYLPSRADSAHTFLFPSCNLISFDQLQIIFQSFKLAWKLPLIYPILELALQTH